MLGLGNGGSGEGGCHSRSLQLGHSDGLPPKQTKKHNSRMPLLIGLFSRFTFLLTAYQGAVPVWALAISTRKLILSRISKDSAQQSWG